MIAPIETSYAGYRFRSRLEARWAVFFDACGLTWAFEAEGFDIPGHGRYLPDFFLPGLAGGAYVEVKREGYEPDRGEVEMWSAFSTGLGQPLVLVMGAPAAISHPGTAGGATWTNYAFLRAEDERSVYLRERPSAWELSQRSPDRAIHSARSARFEHGEAPVVEPELWVGTEDLIANLKQRVNRAIADGDEDAGDIAHRDLIAAEIDQWAPWRDHG